MNTENRAILIKATNPKIKRTNFESSNLSVFKYFGIYFLKHYIPTF